MKAFADRRRLRVSARLASGFVGICGLLCISLCEGSAGQAGGISLFLALIGWGLGSGRGIAFFRIVNPLVALALFLSPLVGVLDWVSSGIFLVLYLQVFKAWTSTRARDHRTSLLLALLMALLASTLTHSLWFAPVLALLALATPVALLTLHLWEHDEEHRAQRPGPVVTRVRSSLALALGPISLVGMFVFFLIIPRFRGGYLASSDEVQSLSGFASDVHLGDIGEIKDNLSMVMRVEAEQEDGYRPRGPFYFRGMALDSFDGRSWRSSQGHLSLAPAEGPPSRLRESDLRMNILLEPLGEPLLFGVSEVLAIKVPERAVHEGRLNSYRYFGEPRRVPYTVWSRERGITQEEMRAEESRLSETDYQRYTALPRGLDPRIRELAREIVGDAKGPFAKSRAVEQWLRDNFEYTLVPEGGTGRQPLSDFLFETRKGHCEYFATALAVLLRSVDVPAVLVSGFYGGEWNELGDYLVVRQADAHAWVEIRTGDSWVQRDATPAGAISPSDSGWLSQLGNVFSGWWERRVLNYDLYAQAETVGGVGAFLGLGDSGSTDSALPKSIAATLAICMLGLVLVSRIGRLILDERTRRQARRRGIAGLFEKAVRHARRRGWHVPDNLPPLSAARWLLDAAGQSAQPMEDLAWFHYRCHYGSESEAVLIDDAREAWLLLKAELVETHRSFDGVEA